LFENCLDDVLQIQIAVNGNKEAATKAQGAIALFFCSHAMQSHLGKFKGRKQEGAGGASRLGLTICR